jgi:uncharacterized protein YraI
MEKNRMPQLNEFKNRSKLSALAVLFSAMMLMSAVCFATASTAATNNSNRR